MNKNEEETMKALRHLQCAMAKQMAEDKDTPLAARTNGHLQLVYLAQGDFQDKVLDLIKRGELEADSEKYAKEYETIIDLSQKLVATIKATLGE